ncbi:MAG: ABC transporter permease [Bacteroides sp.]|nr:ABC transporter permease [Bacteroides sp.]
MSVPFFIARRMSLRTSQRGGSTGLIVAVTGITLSVVVMIVSVAVMTGFRDEIRNKVIGFDSQISIAPKATDNTAASILLSRADLAPIDSILPESAGYTLTARQPAILKTPDNFTGSIIKGVDKDYDWTFIKSNLVDGTIPDYNSDSTIYHIVLSRAIAESLSLSTGEKIDTYFLGSGAYKVRRLKIAGIYDTHFDEYDRNTIFGSLQMLRRIADVPDSCATIAEINGLPDDESIDRTEEAISGAFLDEIYSGRTERHYNVVSIHRLAALYFNWLALLDTNVKVILSLMSLLTVLTLVSSLFILILRRVNTIGILKALGASNRQIRTTFIIMSVRILTRGLITGNLIGIGLLYLQKSTHIVPLNPEAYYLNHVPVVIDWGTIASLNAGIILLSLAVLLLPSAIIATIPPSRAINYE